MKVILNLIVFSGLICSVLAFQNIIDEGLRAGRTLTNELTKFIPFQIPFLSSPTPAPSRPCRWCHLRNSRRYHNQYHNQIPKYEVANKGENVGEAQSVNPAQNAAMNLAQYMNPQMMQQQQIQQPQGTNFMDFILGIVKTVHQSTHAELERARLKQAREQMMTNYLDY